MRMPFDAPLRSDRPGSQIQPHSALCSSSCVQGEGVMTHETDRDSGYQIQQRQHQKQRQQQQLQQQQRPYIAPGAELPEKQHQTKHNPISEASKFASHSCDQ
jgi:hypothetical protein